MSSVLEGCHGDDLLRLGLGWVGVEAGGGGVGAGVAEKRWLGLGLGLCGVLVLGRELGRSAAAIDCLA